MWSPVRDSFPTVCSRSAMIPLRYDPIPTLVGRLYSGQGFDYPCASVTGDHVIAGLHTGGSLFYVRGFLLRPVFAFAPGSLLLLLFPGSFYPSGGIYLDRTFVDKVLQCLAGGGFGHCVSGIGLPVDPDHFGNFTSFI
jgi:hypothetical protein